MADKKEMTAQTASVGADAGQSLTNCTTTIIPETGENFNGEYDFSGTFTNITDPHFLPAISMGIRQLIQHLFFMKNVWNGQKIRMQM